MSVPFVADHRRARENGGEKKGKVEDGRDLLWWGRFDDQRARKAGGWRPCMQSHASISGRFVDTVVRTCRLSGQLQEKSFSSKNLSFETSEAWPGGQSGIIEHCRKQTKFSHWGFTTESRSNTDMKAGESAKRAHVFAGLYSSVHSSVSFGGSGLLMTAPKHFEAFAVEPVRFKVRRRCDNCISLEWNLLVCCARYSACMTVGRNSFRMSNLRWNGGPTAMSAKSAFQILTGLTVQQRAKTFFGGTLGETFEAFAIESDLRLSRRKDLLLERLLKICCNNRRAGLVFGAGQFVCGARCNLQHDGWSKLNLNFTRSRESFATARSENRFWGEKLSPWSGQSAG